jgi:signal transduction histidine kinase
MSNALTIRFTGSILLLIVIGIADYHTSFEISTAAFYLLPVLIFAYQDRLPIWVSLLFALICAAVYGWVDTVTHPYSNDRFFLFNLLLRTILGLAAAIISHRFYQEKQQRTIIVKQKIDLEITNEQLNRFIGVAAHDIRNPVGSVQMMAELMLDDDALNEEMRENIQLIHDAAANSLLILNDTLNISKVQSGTLVLKKERLDYVVFIRDIIRMTGHLAVKKQQTIRLEAPDQPVMVSFDKARLSQVVNNLLTNAIKYSEKGTTIVIRIKMAAGNKLQTEVIDQGLGIDEKYHEHLFDPFTTTDNKPTNNESKTGLGLAIAKKMVELHSGEIGFSSEKGSGSTFYFTIPAEQAIGQ